MSSPNHALAAAQRGFIVRALVKLEALTEPHERRLTLWDRYLRAEVPKYFGFELKGFEAQEGIVTRRHVCSSRRR